MSRIIDSRPTVFNNLWQNNKTSLWFGMGQQGSQDDDLWSKQTLVRPLNKTLTNIYEKTYGPRRYHQASSLVFGKKKMIKNERHYFDNEIISSFPKFLARESVDRTY